MFHDFEEIIFFETWLKNHVELSAQILFSVIIRTKMNFFCIFELPALEKFLFARF
jgi:hypothetical protein